MCLKSIAVVISFPKIIFDIEHYECKSRVMGLAYRLQTSFIFFEGGGRGFSHKRTGISIFIPHVTFRMIPKSLLGLVGVGSCKQSTKNVSTVKNRKKHHIIAESAGEVQWTYSIIMLQTL